jgi:uncharacterized protein (TIGR02265 family)
MVEAPGVNQVKGVAVVSTLRFIKDRFGDAGLRETLAALDAADREAFSNPLVSAWYPLPQMLRLMRQAEARFGGQLPNIHREMGRASADYGLTTVYKIFYKIGSPQFIISKGSRVFSSYYQYGQLEVPESGPGFANAVLRDFKDGGPEYCERIFGWMTRTMELCGTRNLRTSHVTCVHRGDPVCRFEGVWTA